MKLANDIAELLQAAIDTGALKSDPLKHALAVGKLTMWRDGLAKPELIERARTVAQDYGDGNDVEIDDDAVTSDSEGGIWVSGWVYVRDPEESE
jgi:hypothetical protein